MSQNYLLDNRTPEQYKSNIEVSFQIQDEWRECFEYKFNKQGIEASFTTVGCDANGFLTDYSKVTAEPDWEVTMTLNDEQYTFPVEFQYTQDFNTRQYFFKENKVNMCLDRGAVIIQAIHHPDTSVRRYAIISPHTIMNEGEPGTKYKFDSGAKNGYYLTKDQLYFHKLRDTIYVGEWLQ